jgi:predicted nucleic acid-binding protein
MALIVLDTNVIIDYFNNLLIAEDEREITKLLGEDVFVISIITRMEVMVGLLNEKKPTIFQAFINTATTLNILPEIEREAIEVRKTYKLKLPDAIIAATALFLDARLVTNDQSGFSRIPDLNIWIPKRL